MTYAASRLDVAFAETVLHEQGYFVDNRWVIEQACVDERSIVRFVRADGRLLRLADLTGVGLKQLGMSNDPCASDDDTASMQVSAGPHTRA